MSMSCSCHACAACPLCSDPVDLQREMQGECVKVFRCYLPESRRHGAAHPCRHGSSR